MLSKFALTYRFNNTEHVGLKRLLEVQPCVFKSLDGDRRKMFLDLSTTVIYAHGGVVDQNLRNIEDSSSTLPSAQNINIHSKDSE